MRKAYPRRKSRLQSLESRCRKCPIRKTHQKFDVKRMVIGGFCGAVVKEVLEKVINAISGR